MALPELDQKRIEKLAGAFVEKHRPPPHVRPELDVGFRISGQSLEIFEIRPAFSNPAEKLERPVARATYVKSGRYWKVYWMRADLKWHAYQPQPVVETVDKFLRLVEADEYSCFFG